MIKHFAAVTPPAQRPTISCRLFFARKRLPSKAQTSGDNDAWNARWPDSRAIQQESVEFVSDFLENNEYSLKLRSRTKSDGFRSDFTPRFWTADRFCFDFVERKPEATDASRSMWGSGQLCIKSVHVDSGIVDQLNVDAT